MHLKNILTVLSLFFLFHNFHVPKFRVPFHSLPILQAQTLSDEIEEALSGFDESESDVMKTLELEPRHFGALSGQGLIRIALEDWTGAIYFFESALKINPHMHGVLMNLKYAIYSSVLIV